MIELIDEVLAEWEQLRAQLELPVVVEEVEEPVKLRWWEKLKWTR